MSIIERAMGKQLGVEVAKDEPDAKESSSTENKEAIADRNAPADVRDVSELDHSQQASTERAQTQTTAAASSSAINNRVAARPETPPDCGTGFR